MGLEIYDKHCMFSGKRLEDGERVYGNLVITYSYMSGPMGWFPPVPMYHILQMETINGRMMNQDDLVDGRTLAMFLGEIDENDRAVYVPLVKVLSRLASCPKELWAVKDDPHSHEWNDRPVKRIVHYNVHAFEAETGRYFVNIDGLPGLKHRHWVKGMGLYRSLEEAQDALEGETR